MSKGKLLEDTFEQLVELGQSTASKTVKSVAQTLNPLSALDKADLPLSSRASEQSKRVEGSKNKNHTPLNFEKLKDKLQNKEKVQADALRNRLFQIVRQGDEKMLMQKRQKEIEKKHQEEYLIQEKKRKEEEKKRQQQIGDLPLGKIRSSIFSVKKTAERSHAETKPATGKQ